MYIFLLALGKSHSQINKPYSIWNLGLLILALLLVTTIFIARPHWPHQLMTLSSQSKPTTPGHPPIPNLQFPQSAQVTTTMLTAITMALMK